MKFISEQIIDGVVEALNPDQFDDYLEDFGLNQEDYIRFIATENFKLLSEKEYDILIFLSIVIWKSVLEIDPSLDLIPGEVIETMDEKNWLVYNEEQHFSKVIDRYFEDYQQEDLLAFVEDTLQKDEESDLSQVGREILFITCKSFIDANQLRQSDATI